MTLSNCLFSKPEYAALVRASKVIYGVTQGLPQLRKQVNFL